VHGLVARCRAAADLSRGSASPESSWCVRAVSIAWWIRANPHPINAFFDQRTSPNAIARSTFGFEPTAEAKYGGYCRAHGFVGTIWSSGKWTDVVVHEAHVGLGFVITDAEVLL
jgi:hypothetical protein